MSRPELCSKRLLIDMDAVMVDLLTPWLKRYNEMFDDNLTQDQLLSYETYKYAKAGKKIYNLLREPGLYRNLKPLPGAIETFNELIDEGYDIWVVTAAPITAPGCMVEKMEWVEENLPRFPMRQVIICHDKFLIDGDIIFEDNPKHLKHHNMVNVAMEMPYNVGEGDVRIRSWEMFYRALREMSRIVDPLYEQYRIEGLSDERYHDDWVLNGRLTSDQVDLIRRTILRNPILIKRD